MRSLYSRCLLRLALLALLSGSLAAPALAHVGGPGPSGPGPSGPGPSGPGPGTGPSGAPGPGGGGYQVGPSSPGGGDAGSAVKALSRGAETAIDECDYQTPECVADILDRYAAALRQIAPQLPPALRNLPEIVERAATRVRVSRTRAEAVKALKIAIAEVHKSIALLKADDPAALPTGTREGSFVAETLQVADNKLEKAVGL
jgi:hypothetical protein